MNIFLKLVFIFFIIFFFNVKDWLCLHIYSNVFYEFLNVFAIFIIAIIIYSIFLRLLVLQLSFVASFAVLALL